MNRERQPQENPSQLSSVNLNSIDDVYSAYLSSEDPSSFLIELEETEPGIYCDLIERINKENELKEEIEYLRRHGIEPDQEEKEEEEPIKETKDSSIIDSSLIDPNWRAMAGEDLFRETMNKYKIGYPLWDSVVMSKDGVPLMVKGISYKKWDEFEREFDKPDHPYADRSGR